MYQIKCLRPCVLLGGLQPAWRVGLCHPELTRLQPKCRKQWPRAHRRLGREGERGRVRGERAEEEEEEEDARRRRGGSGQRHRWPTVVHHGTNGHDLRKAVACTDRTGVQTDPDMEAPDPLDPPVWGFASKADRADEAT